MSDRYLIQDVGGTHNNTPSEKLRYKGDGQRQSARVSKSIAAHSSCRVTRSHYAISCNAHHVSRSRRKLVGCAPMEYCGNQIHLQLSSSRSELQLEAGPKLFPIHSK